jgi:hypothetical protein
VLERHFQGLVFDYGRRISSADTPQEGYTTPLGRPLVLAPVKWNIPDDAVYEWTVSGGAHASAQSATEYFTFNPTAQGEYTVTVATTVNGRPLSASTKVFCCPPAGTYQNTANPNSGGVFDAPGLNVNNSWKGKSLGGFGGRIIRAFATSLPNSPGDDLRITGNAFSNWIEPGVVWVMQDSNGNGLPDDAWHELRGEGVELMRRYAITYYANGSWQNNRGEAGNITASLYPGAAPSPMTFTGTRVFCPDSLPGVLDVKGYVDTFDSLFDIDDAVQADGSPIALNYIDFVMVQTGEHDYYTSTGEKSTEAIELGAYVLYDNARKLTGVSDGEGGYTYRIVNNSGYSLTVSVAVPDGAFTPYTVGAETKIITLSADEAYFDYSGGNVVFVISGDGNTVTFSPGPS